MRKPGILLIDNDPDVVASTGDYLERAGYRVLTANNASEALRLCHEEIIHLAVVDIRLKDDADVDDESGLTLARQLDPSIFKIILTGQPPSVLFNNIVITYGDHEVRFLHKRESVTKLLETIRQAFSTNIKLNLDLRTHHDRGVRWHNLVDNLKMFRGCDDAAKRRAVQVLENLTCRLFYGVNEVKFWRITPGYGHCIVTLAQQIIDGVPGTDLAIKIGPRESIAQEEGNYRKYVERHVPNCATLQLGPVWSHELGAIAYAFVGERGRLVKSFFDHYQSEGVVSNDQVKMTLTHLFQDSCVNWYAPVGKRPPQEDKRKPLDTLYRSDLNLLSDLQVTKLKSQFDLLIRQDPPGNFSIRLLDDDLLQVQIAERRPIKLPNPIQFALEEHNSTTGQDFFPLPSQVAITHGDLHSGNIMVSQAGRTWLIDFFKTGWGHVLRDFAELESDIKFSLLPSESLRERYDLELVLLTPQSLNESFDGLLKHPTKTQTRALETIQHLRSLACQLTDVENVREYHIALLFLALKRMVGFTSADSAKSSGSVAQYHALLSAALICERLQMKAQKTKHSTEASMKIFLSYASEDRNKVDDLYQGLSDAGFHPWMDHRDITPGEEWVRAIGKAIHGSEIFMACLSRHSAGKRGVIQKEIRQALDVYEGMLPDDIYLIPVLLEDCELPERLAKFQAVRLYQPDGWTRLLHAIELAKARRSK
jgi:ActR/RegA family two-component response regulator